jgi:hypothetical protein
MFYHHNNHSYYTIHDDYDTIDSPRWEDMFTFRQHGSRSWSIITDTDAEELTSLLGNPIRGPFKRKLVEWCNRMVTRNFLLVIVPTIIVSLRDIT